MTVLVQVPSHKGENEFGFGGEVQDKHFAQEVTVFYLCFCFALVHNENYLLGDGVSGGISDV